MRTRVSLFSILILLICCLDWSGAFFFKKSWKSGKGYSGVQNYGNNGYGNYGYGNSGYGNPGYGNPGYGNYGYGNYAGGYGYNYTSYPAYNSYSSYPSYSGHSSYSYPKTERKPSGKRQGRTYSQIAKVLNPAPYVGLGGYRFLPRTPFSALWG
ncbi:shematrin-like protein 1 [Drosophila ficusphila]|uniref:shematrin-like protein 1 n=1 Tax=Drosophila ficusphila TaxID=30025 RepID=UPI0007E7ED38|nr:shematrin-like protein 1 [Drosophila ficusphila]